MPNNKTKRDAGFTLIETMIACVILAICSTGILALFTISVVKNANRGDDATRTTEYAQDKMEQLMALQFQDITSNTIYHLSGSTLQPPCLDFSVVSLNPLYAPSPCSGTGLTAPGGSITADQAQYVDYIALVANTWISSDSPTGATFVRRWRIDLDSTGKVKIITVYVICKAGLSVSSSAVKDGLAPQTTLMSQKTAVADTTF